MNRARSLLKVSSVHRAGYRGFGTCIAILDTGIEPHHPDFFRPLGHSRITGFADFTKNSAPVSLQSWSHAYDDNGHGTHVAGIAGGNGFVSGNLYCGIAPECNLCILKVLDFSGNGKMKNILNALEWILMHHKEYNIRVVNISVGTTLPQYLTENCPLVKTVDNIWNQGIIVVAAAGNDGPVIHSIGAPGISRNIVTVGSCDFTIPIEIKGKRLLDYSSRGPTVSCIKKPDIVTPGSNITSCSTHFPSVSHPDRSYHAAYTQKSGTSMSTPMVSGAASVFLSKYPDATPKDFKIALRESASSLSLPHSRQGWGLLNLEKLCSIS